jgi:hypothetical protein
MSKIDELESYLDSIEAEMEPIQKRLAILETQRDKIVKELYALLINGEV